MGYLAAFNYIDGNFAATPHELPISVRDFHWDDAGRLVLVNRGMHGLSIYRYDSVSPGGFTKLADATPPGGAVDLSALSADGRFAAATIQSSLSVTVYSIE